MTRRLVAGGGNGYHLEGVALVEGFALTSSRMRGFCTGTYTFSEWSASNIAVPMRVRFEHTAWEPITPVAGFGPGGTSRVRSRAIPSSSRRRSPPDVAAPVFTCNCVLNYLYGDLEHRRTGALVGPMTFGEIAYQSLNQTLVYVTIGRVS